MQTPQNRNKRVAEILDRQDEIEQERENVRMHLADLDAEEEKLWDEFGELTGRNNKPANDTKEGRKCKLCGEIGHIIARTKTADGKPTCKTFPNGKSEE